jgi:hypothetical protein
MKQHIYNGSKIAVGLSRRVLPWVLLLQLGFSGCQSAGPSAPPDLKAGSAVIQYMSRTRTLSRSTFSAVFPNGTPRQFVSWLFSDMGAAEWPWTEEEAASDPMTKEQAAAIRAPLVPKDVDFVHTAPDPSRGKQIVVKWNDAKRVVIVEGYVDPAQPPVLVEEWEFPKVQSADPIAKGAAQSMQEMGGSSQAF